MAIRQEWQKGTRACLLILPTGTGKTIVFADVIQNVLREGGRALILAHRAELLNQAADKIQKVTGLGCAVEKAEETAEDTWYNITVGSVQSMHDKRLDRIGSDTYTHIIVDEAHHTLAVSYMRVLEHFKGAKVLGVTATADRGDKRNLGVVFDRIAYELTLPQAIREGWLVPIKALTLPIEMSLSHTGGGDYVLSECANAIEPYLFSIAQQLKQNASDRKTVAFLPLISTSQKFLDMLLDLGIEAREVNGESADRADTLEWFNKAGKGAVLCNAMLLTEGWDEPSADCICVLRPTKIRSLYTQMVGRGTRLHPGKKDLLLLDFLWMTEKHDLCRPTHLVCDNPDLAPRIAEILAEEDAAVDLLQATEDATGTAAAEREESLRKELEAQRHRKRTLVDPLQYTASISGGELPSYQEEDKDDLKAMQAPLADQIKFLEKAGILTDEIETRQEAQQLMDKINARRDEGLSTPKQIKVLERYGFRDVATWTSVKAQKIVGQIAGNGWRVPAWMVIK